MMALRTLLLTLTLVAAPLALADHDGRPHEACKDRANPCTDVRAGEMSCMPAQGKANDYGVVVGAADSGEFKLEALGKNLAGSGATCQFEIRVDAAAIRFNQGYTVGLLAPYGGATSTSNVPCSTSPGQECVAVATFAWWRAEHGVTFDVPFTLLVNGQEVAHGEVHYFDPPLFETLVGGPFVLP